MYIYRIVLDAYDSRHGARSARVVTYSQGYNRNEALKRLGNIYIASNGLVSDGIYPWPGNLNLPRGSIESRTLPEYNLVNIRVVKKRGRPHILSEETY